MNQKEKNDDKWIGYYFIPFAAIFVYYIGGDDPLNDISIQTKDLIYIALNIVSGLIIWRIIKKVMFSLIKEEVSLLLFFKAFLLNLFLSLFFLIITRFLHDKFIVKIETSIEFYTIDLPTDILFIFIINLIYLILFYKRKIHQIQYLNEPKFESPKKILVQGIKKSFSLFPSDIAYIELEQKICFLYTYSGEQIMTVHSLNQIFEKLPESIFFQVNRQFILHREVIKSFQLTDTRRLKIELVPSFEYNKRIFVSKAKSPSFKNWFLVKEHSKNKNSILQDS